MRKVKFGVDYLKILIFMINLALTLTKVEKCRLIP
jgi:hypothetical protein